jgi:hypothetical protein
MSRIEDLLRTATRETAAEVTQESIPPLDVAALPLPRPRRRWRFGRPFAPLLAAAAVVLVVALSLVLSTVLAAPRPPVAPAPVGAGVPQYYVALTTALPEAKYPLSEQPAQLTVRSTFTGKVLTTVTAPRPYGQFVLVDGTADDRTFLVGAQVWDTDHVGAGEQISAPVRLFLLHYDPSTRRAKLSALPLPQFNGMYLEAASISPDGTRIAVGYQSGHYATQIRVYTLPSGAERTWSATLNAKADSSGPNAIGLSRDNAASIAWAENDRTISFVWSGGTNSTDSGAHLFDTGTPPGGDLLSASRFVESASQYMGGVPAGDSDFICDTDPFLSANGAYVLCGGYTDPSRTTHGYYPDFPAGSVTQGVGEFSAATGKLITILGAFSAPVATVENGVNVITDPLLLWASPDAKTLIIEDDGHVFAVADGHRQAIPWSADTSTALGANVPGAAW